MSKGCYLCGSTENMTSDHVPPKSFFPQPVPNNVQLITVPCCEECNQSYSVLDEDFRSWATLGAKTDAGKWVFGQALKSMNRRKQFKSEMIKGIKTFNLQTPEGKVKVPTVAFPMPRAQEFLCRITKGLLTHFYPHYNHSQEVFDVIPLWPTPETNKTLAELTPKLYRDERVKGVFECWSGFAADAHFMGVWIYIFYDGIAFMVQHCPLPLAPILLARE